MKPPASPAAIDPEWLTSALRERHPGADVESVELLGVSQMTNLHARIAVRYRTDAGAPTSMFCKLLPEGARRAAIASTRMGPTEVRFYRDLAKLVPLRVPAVSVAIEDPDDDTFVLLMEDLAATGCEVSAGPRGVTSEEAVGALTALAHLHAGFEDPQRRAREAPWARLLSIGSDYGAEMLQFALDHRRDRISDAFAEISRRYIGLRRELHALWTEGPPTLVHGDPHIGNLFFDHGQVGFLDWGIVNVNTPMRDISYFLNMAMDVEDRRRDHEQLLRHYLDVRRSLGATPITFDEAIRAHRIHAAYCVVASCQVVLFPEDATPARRVHSEAFLGRAEAAIADLDALGALAAEGIEI